MSDESVIAATGPSSPRADATLIQCLGLLRQFLARPGYAFTDTESLANLRAAHECLAVVNAAYLTVLADVDTRPDVLPHVAPGKAAATFLREALRVSPHQAGRDVRAAQALASTRPDLPRMAQALADGEISRDHVDVAVSTLQRIPKALKTAQVPEEDDAGRPTGTLVAGATVIDAILAREARTQAPSTVEALGRQIVHHLDPDRAERGFNADSYERRSCTWHHDFAGMTLLHLTLDPATSANVLAAVKAWAEPTPPGTATDDQGRTITVKDKRTASQRHADALAALVLTGASTRQPVTTPSPTAPTEAGPAAAADRTEEEAEEAEGQQGDGDDGREDGEGSAADEVPAPFRATQSTTAPPFEPAPFEPASFEAKPFAGVEVCLLATVDQIAAAYGATDTAALQAGLARLSLAGPIGAFSGTALPPEVVARLTCDSPVRRILLSNDGAILHHGRSQRFATPAQRRALAARDNGCVIPGCYSPPEWCEAHHIIPWKDGGETNIDEMVLLCARHHTAHHAGVYQIQMRDGLPWVRVPAWQDPTTPWLHNTTHADHHRTARDLARRLTEQPPLPWGDPHGSWGEPGHAA